MEWSFKRPDVLIIWWVSPIGLRTRQRLYTLFIKLEYVHGELPSPVQEAYVEYTPSAGDTSTGVRTVAKLIGKCVELGHSQHGDMWGWLSKKYITSCGKVLNAKTAVDMWCLLSCNILRSDWTNWYVSWPYFTCYGWIRTVWLVSQYAQRLFCNGFRRPIGLKSRGLIYQIRWKVLVQMADTA